MDECYIWKEKKNNYYSQLCFLMQINKITKQQQKEKKKESIPLRVDTIPCNSETKAWPNDDMQRLLDNNNIYRLLKRVFSSGSKDFLLNLVCATSGMHNIQRMAGRRAGHPEGWPCMSYLLFTPCSTDPDTLPVAVPRLGHVCP